MVEWALAPRFLNLRRGLVMVTVVGIHAGIVGVWAQHSQANISFGQPILDMALEFSSVEANTSEHLELEQPNLEQPASEQPASEQPASEQPASEQPASEQPALEQPIESTRHQVVEPKAEFEPEDDIKSKSKPESKPKAKLESHTKKQTTITVPKNDANKAFTQKTKSPQTKTSTGTPLQTANHAPDPAQFMRLSQLMIDGSPPVPHYPKQARLNGEEGLVVVRIRIDRWGGVETIHVYKSSGFELLDRAALDATKKIRFKPHQISTMSHRVRVDIPFNFILSPK